jgi:hypothetical protein
MTLTRTSILAAKDILIEKVLVPEWGGEVFVKGMTGAERDQFEAAIVEIRGTSQRTNLNNVRARLASLTICDKDGTRLFKEADIQELGRKSASALQRVFAVAQRLSGLSQEDVKELTKELEQNPLGDSASD